MEARRPTGKACSGRATQRLCYPPSPQRAVWRYAAYNTMWLRRTFHECAEELKAQSDFFRGAYVNRLNFSPDERERRMVSASERGVEMLRILALSIRADQDAGLTDSNPAAVGALRVGATDDEITRTLTEYRPPYTQQRGFNQLTLRQALNKIAHADPFIRAS